jgi:hypothetical protein
MIGGPQPGFPARAWALENEGIDPAIGSDVEPILSGDQGLEVMQAGHHFRAATTGEQRFTRVASKPV